MTGSFDLSFAKKALGCAFASALIFSKSPFNRIITHKNYQHNKKRINQNVDDDDDDDEEELNTPHINKTKKM